MTQGDAAHGIYAVVTAGDSAITEGDITATGNGAHGISAALGAGGLSHLSIANDHSIAVYGANADAIYVDNQDNYGNILNTGKIYSASSDGIHTMGSGMIINNNGEIIGGRHSVNFEGIGNTLNLFAGTKLQGIFKLGSGNTLNIGKGMNTAFSYLGTPLIGTPGAAYVDRRGIMVSGSLSDEAANAPRIPETSGTLAVVDPTGFSAQDEMLNDLTRIIADIVDTRLAEARQGDFSGTVTMNGPAIVPTADAPPDSPGMVAWAAGLVQSRDQNADGVDVGFDITRGGFMLGLDGAARTDVRLGVFIGASVAKFDTNTSSQSIDTDSYFAGLYANLRKDAYFLNLAVTAGLSSQSSDRAVANNVVDGGIERARADYDGVFVSPSATVGADIALPSAVLTPSLRVRYAAQSLESYDEHDSEADLSVDQRTAQVFDARAQLAIMVPVVLDGGTFRTIVRVGGDATYADGDKVGAVLLGQSVDFNVGNDDQALQGFAGLDLWYLLDSGLSVFAGAEYGLGSDQNSTLQADAGITLAF